LLEKKVLTIFNITFGKKRKEEFLLRSFAFWVRCFCYFTLYFIQTHIEIAQDEN